MIVFMFKFNVLSFVGKIEFDQFPKRFKNKQTTLSTKLSYPIMMNDNVNNFYEIFIWYNMHWNWDEINLTLTLKQYQKFIELY